LVPHMQNAFEKLGLEYEGAVYEWYLRQDDQVDIQEVEKLAEGVETGDKSLAPIMSMCNIEKKRGRGENEGEMARFNFVIFLPLVFFSR
jgi:hypothetical protein